MLFYPADVAPPEQLQTPKLLLQPLTPVHVELDYAALMDSKEMLRRWSNSSWVQDDFPITENYRDLTRHDVEHQRREAFTYTVLNPSATECLGCVYITPLEYPLGQFNHSDVVLKPTQDYEASVSFWIRQPYLIQELDKHLFESLQNWFLQVWPFNRVVFLTSEQDIRQIQLFINAGLQPFQELEAAGFSAKFVMYA